MKLSSQLRATTCLHSQDITAFQHRGGYDGILAAPLPWEDVQPANDNGYDTVTPFEPHTPSTGVRRPPHKGTGSWRGARVDGEKREIVLESDQERRVATVALADPRTAKLEDQPARLGIELEGNRHNVVPDFRVIRKDGHSVGLNVKPNSRRARSGIDAVSTAIKAQHPEFADGMKVITEVEVGRNRADIAALILRARWLVDEACLAAMRHVVSQTRGIVTVGSLVDQVPTLGAINAVVAMIADGDLNLIGVGRFGRNSRVRAARHLSHFE